MEPLRLLSPSVEWESEYLAVARECESDPVLEASGSSFPDPKKHPDFASFIQYLSDCEDPLRMALGRVPQSTFWAFIGERLVGICKLRHYLRPDLERHGGHIGYVVRRSERNKGYGTQMLALTLEKARALALERVLLTCYSENTGSAKVIKRNGGVLTEELDPGTSRYWIELC